MDLTPYRNQFDLHMLLPFSEEFQQLKVKLRNKGHSVFHSTQESKFLADFKQSPSHLVIFESSLINMPLDDFLAECLEIASQTHFIVLGPSKERIKFFEYRDYGVLDYVSLEDQLPTLLEWSIDNALERVVLKVLNKNLVEENDSLTNRLTSLRAKEAVALTLAEGFIESTEEDVQTPIPQTKEEASTQHSEVTAASANSENTEPSVSSSSLSFFPEEDISNLLNLYENARHRDEILQVFFHSLEEYCEGGTKILFFKYLNPVHLLVATHGCGIPLEQIQGAGIKLSPEEILEAKNLLLSPRGFDSLNKMLKDVFHIENCYVKPLLVREDIDGLLVFFGENIEPFNTIRFNNRFSLFRVSFERFCFFKRQMELELEEILNHIKTYEEFSEIITDKIDQLQRQKLGMSIIRMSIDRLQNIEEKYGPTAAASAIRALAVTGKKFTRSADDFVRTSSNEFAILANHLTPKDATILAERIRLALEGMDVPPITGSLTVSLGVSSYPQLATTTESLIKSSLQALSAAMVQGGNRVGLARVVRRPKVEKFSSNDLISKG